MAHQYTDFPSPLGEKNLAKQLAGTTDLELHLWFALVFIPGVRANDILLCQEIAGMAVICLFKTCFM